MTTRADKIAALQYALGEAEYDLKYAPDSALEAMRVAALLSILAELEAGEQPERGQ